MWLCIWDYHRISDRNLGILAPTELQLKFFSLAQGSTAAPAVSGSRGGVGKVNVVITGWGWGRASSICGSSAGDSKTNAQGTFHSQKTII